MTFATLLISSCTIRRYTDGAADAYGNTAKVWADHLTAEPCRLSYPKGRFQRQIQRGTEIVPVDTVLYIDDVDVTEHDQIIIDGNTWEILFVATLQDGTADHHLELSMKRVIP